MSGKTYTLTEEQANLLSNDLVDVLNKSQEVSNNLNNLNSNSEKIVKQFEKHQDISENIDFLINKVLEAKNTLNSSFSNVEDLSSSLKKNNDSLNLSAKDIDKKLLKAIEKIEAFNNGNNNTKFNYMTLFLGIGVGIALFLGWLGLVYDSGIYSKIYNASITTIEKVL